MSMCYQAEEPDPQLERMSDLLKSDSVLFMVFKFVILIFSFNFILLAYINLCALPFLLRKK